MKKILLPFLVLLIMSSCDIHVYEAPFDPRLNFVGFYEAEEFSETYNDLVIYELDILRDDDPYSNRVYLRNFYALPIEVMASINQDRLIIPRQQIDWYLIEGAGRLVNGEITLTYSVRDLSRPGRPSDFCNTVLYFR